MAKVKVTQISVMCLIVLTGCGGSDSSGDAGSNGSDFIDSKDAAALFVGSWGGALTYTDSNTYCKWALKVNLKNTHYPQQLDSLFKGTVTANLVSSRYTTSARNSCMVQGKVALQWYAYSYKQNGQWKHMLSFSYWRDEDYNFGHDIYTETPSEFFTIPLFSSDKVIFKNFRLESDDPIIRLSR